MKDVREKLIEMRNTLDELIKQLEPGTEVTSTPEEPLENIIFNARLFNTPEKLGQLKRIIGSFISENPAKDEIKVDARKMNQFFCLYAALWSRPLVLANESMADFVRQMALWFPRWVSTEKTERRLSRSPCGGASGPTGREEGLPVLYYSNSKLN